MPIGPLLDHISFKSLSKPDQLKHLSRKQLQITQTSHQKGSSKGEGSENQLEIMSSKSNDSGEKLLLKLTTEPHDAYSNNIYLITLITPLE